MKLKNSTEDIIDFICLKLNNKKCNKKQKKILILLFKNLYTFEVNELLPNSSMIAFLMTGCNQDYPQVLSSSINCFGEAHFPFTKIIDFINNGFTTKDKYYPGFGHPIYKKMDPRIVFILKEIKKINYKTPNVDSCLKFSEKNNICLNIGGFVSALLLDLNLNVYSINYITIIARILGLTLIYKKTKQKNLRFLTSLDSIEKHKNLFVPNKA